MSSVEHQQAVDLGRAAAAQIREYEVAAEPTVPDEPSSLASRARRTAHIAHSATHCGVARWHSG
jgi:hypothetical protein